MSQILRIVLLGTNSLPKCNSVARHLQRKGLKARRQPIDKNNAEHLQLIAQAHQTRAVIEPEDPLICLQDAEDGLTLVDGDNPETVVCSLFEHEQYLQNTLIPTSA